MNEFGKLNLAPHNIRGYKNVKKAFLTERFAALIHATGTGKSFISLQLALDNPTKKFLFLTPLRSIIEHFQSIIHEYGLEEQFKNVEFRTYTSLINCSTEDLESMNYDYLVLDEFHHIGAPVWGDRVSRLIDLHPDMKVLGMSAYTVRDRCTSYERDMVNPLGDELFSNKVVSKYDLCDAIMDGVLPKPIYKSAFIDYDKIVSELEEQLEKENHKTLRYQEIKSLIARVKSISHTAKNAEDVFKNNIKPDGKYIYFCPVRAKNENADVEAIMDEVKAWVTNMGLTMDDVEFYRSTDDMGDQATKNRKAFYNDVDLNGKSTKGKLRIMFAINQYNEGVHAPGVDGVIMGRGTKSDIVFNEQLGRALSINGKSPLVIDLAGNIDFIKDLQDNLKDRVREYHQAKGFTPEEIEIELRKYSFDLDIYNEDIYEILNEVKARLGLGFYDNLKLARNYYDYYHHLNIPAQFRTIDGIHEDPDGVQLGYWIRTLRKTRSEGKLSSEKIRALNDIHMEWNNINNDEVWYRNYNLAVTFRKNNPTKQIPLKFITFDGITYDPNGVRLGIWIRTQRNAYQGKGNYKITQEKIDLLTDIGIVLEPFDRKGIWLEKYSWAKAYYDKYGDTEVPPSYHGDENFDLCTWLKYQRNHKDSLDDDQIDLLNKIEMRWENIDPMAVWMEKYLECVDYYHEHGNSDIEYEYVSPTGKHLGYFLKNMRILYQKGTLKQDKIDLLNDIQMRWDNIDLFEEWLVRYDEAKWYYDTHGNLDVPKGFVMKNGNNLYSWVKYQKERFQEGRMSDKEIDMLFDIGLDLRSWILTKK